MPKISERNKNYAKICHGCKNNYNIICEQVKSQFQHLCTMKKSIFVTCIIISVILKRIFFFIRNISFFH
jgi:hypothetical protein